MSALRPRVAELRADPTRVFATVTGWKAGPATGSVDAPTLRRQGRYHRHRYTDPGSRDVAPDATLRAAALRTGGTEPLRVRATDLRWRVRRHAAPMAVALVLDNSYSLQADRMVEKVKGLADALLSDPARRGDRVGVVAFRGGTPQATVAVPMTGDAALVSQGLTAVPLSGRTPLADALRRSRVLLRQECHRQQGVVPVMVVISDGVPTVAIRHRGDPYIDAIAQARAAGRDGIRCVIVDAADKPGRQRRCGPALAEASGGTWLHFNEAVPSIFGDVLDTATDQRRKP